MKRVLAFDFGASGGRAITGTYDGGVITLTEVHRFENVPVTVGGTLYWNMEELMREIKTGLKKAFEAGSIDSVGIDTWGVDFGLIGADGALLEDPVHYRDGRTDGIPDEAFKIMPRQTLYAKTGIQIMQINTLFQLLSLKKNRPDMLAKAEKLLFMPDLFAYLLTGVTKTEYTIASTSQMLDPFTRDWDFDMLEAFGIPRRILCPVSQPPSVYGKISESICHELGIGGADIVSIASHDTASAVLAVPAGGEDENYVYISSGTWSLFGTEADAPIVNERSASANFTNEGGIGGKIRFLKNIMGLWLVQEARRQYREEGYDLSFSELENEALAAEPFKCFIDTDAPEFLKPGDMPAKVAAFCERTGQRPPSGRGEVMRCIYESLAMKYKYTLAEIEHITGRNYDRIYIVGGGVQSGLLCRMAADACGLPVSAGPSEATALGNVAAQLIAGGALKDIKHAREVIKSSLRPAEHTPNDSEKWNARFGEFKNLIL